MARTSKKRARELKHDKFRDATMGAFDRIGHRMEGRGRTILYALGAALALLLAFGLWSWWDGRQDAEASAALGRAIGISEAQLASAPVAGSRDPVFPTERERAQAAVKEFEAVAAKYGGPYADIARYMAATQLLTVERPRGLSELEKLSKGGDKEIAARAAFALAQARESEGQYDAAAELYNSLLKDNTSAVASDTLNLRLASVYEKQGKKKEAADILFQMIKSAREAKGKDGKPLTPTGAVTDAEEKLQTLDPARYEQLPEKPPTGAGSLPF